MLGSGVTGVMDAASGDDVHVAVFTDVEGVVHHVFQTRFRDDDWDEHGLALGARLDVDVYPRMIRLGGYLYVGTGVALYQLAVFADIEGAFRHAMDVSDLCQQIGIDRSEVLSHDVLLAGSGDIGQMQLQRL